MLQGKLGKLPKNQRLKDAMAAHKDAKPKPKVDCFKHAA